MTNMPPNPVCWVCSRGRNPVVDPPGRLRYAHTLDEVDTSAGAVFRLHHERLCSRRLPSTGRNDAKSPAVA